MEQVYSGRLMVSRTSFAQTLGVIELNVDGRLPIIDASCKVLNSREFRKGL